MLVQVPEAQLEQVQALLEEFPHWKAVPSKEDNGVFFVSESGEWDASLKVALDELEELLQGWLSDAAAGRL